MANRRIVWALACLFVAVASGTAFAAQRAITFEEIRHEKTETQAEYLDVEVTTPLAQIILSEQGGVVKSVFFSFAPFGSSPDREPVPGTTTTIKTLERQYRADTFFPFAVAVNGEREESYRLADIGVDEKTGVFHAVFEGMVAGIGIEKRYTISPDAVYTIGFEVVVDNRTTATAQVQLTVGDYLQKVNGYELVYMFDGQGSSQLLARESYKTFGGAGFIDKQMVFFLTPKGGASVTPTFERTASGSQRVSFKFAADPGAKTSATSELYAGRRRFIPMETAGIEALDKHGVWSTIMVWVIRFLDLLYRATGNYGWAIILFTILSRLLLYPLMSKQMHSMAKLQRLQPKMKRIQERFKDDKVLLQQRLMELYKKEGINPMSGCLPLLSQFPIMLLIWRAVLLASEGIRLSPGFLWMPDLSMADPYFILVIVTTAIMLFQQWKLTPQTGSQGGPGAKLFGYVFPILMAIWLWKFPAGLWLYYLLTTAAQAAQQAVVNRQLTRADRLAAETSEGEIELESDDADGRSSQGS